MRKKPYLSYLTLPVLSVAAAFMFLRYSGREDVRALNSVEGTQEVLHLTVVTPQGMPVSVHGAAVTIADGRGISRLSLAISTREKKNIARAQLLQYVFDSVGSLRGAEGWIEDLNLAGAEEKKISVPLSNKVARGDQPFLVIQRLYCAHGEWIAEMPRPLEIIKDYLNDRNVAIPIAQFVRRNVSQPLGPNQVSKGESVDVCDEQLRETPASCPNGLHSFSCDPSTGAFSFTCKVPSQS